MIAVINSRMSSSRLPGKALTLIGSRTLLEWVINSAQQCASFDDLVVATSTHPSDDAISHWCRIEGHRYVRGPLDDVLARTLLAADKADAEFVVRMNGDSPFIFPNLVDTLVETFLLNPQDLVTNVFPRTFPRGQSVEVISVDGLREANDQSLSDLEREHVTQYFYRKASNWRILNVLLEDFDASCRDDIDLSRYSLCLDVYSDLNYLEAFLNVAGTDKPWELSWGEIRDALRCLGDERA